MAKAVEQAAGFNPITTAHGLGLRSNHAYAAGFASVGISLAAWLISRGKKGDSKAQSDRWAIFIGHWPPPSSPSASRSSTRSRQPGRGAGAATRRPSRFGASQTLDVHSNT